MKKFISVLCFLVILTGGSAASATTTTQIWYFGTDQVMPVPDVVDNPYGVPQLKVRFFSPDLEKKKNDL